MPILQMSTLKFKEVVTSPHSPHGIYPHRKGHDLNQEICTQSEGTRTPFPVAASLLMSPYGSGRTSGKLESASVK